MNDTMRPTPALLRALPGLMAVAVPLGSFLAFSLLLVGAKQLVPAVGGASSPWLAALLYLPLAGLLSTAAARWLVRRPLLVQLAVVCGLAVVAPVFLQLPSDEATAAPGLGALVGRLAVATFPALLLLLMTAPLFRAWLRMARQEVPGYLDAATCLATLAALILFPAAFEREFWTPELLAYLRGLVAVAAGLLAVAGYLVHRSGVAETAPEPEAPVAFTPGTAAGWLALRALAAVAMLAGTTLLTAELGAGPLAWVPPLALFVLAEAVASSRHWRRWMTLTTIVWLAISLAGYMAAKGFTSATVYSWVAFWTLSVVASASLLAHALIGALRPPGRPKLAAVSLDAGLLAGALVAAVLVPQLCVRPTELVLAAGAVLTVALLWLGGRREFGAVAVTTAVIFGLLLMQGHEQASREQAGGARVTHYRNLLGHVLVTLNRDNAVLSYETTTRGSQLNSTEAAARHPTLYYTESSGVGRTLAQLQAARPAMRVGVIGLGAGTLAAYARKDDVYDFWEIDPKIVRIARDYFTYVRDAAGRVNLVPQEGRQALERSREDYDLLVVDAFAGDGVPPYLLTREALKTYQRRLQARNGLLVIHASARYSQLYPVVAAAAQTLRESTIEVVTEITTPAAEHDWDPTRTDYLIVGPGDQAKEILGWFPEEEDKGRVRRQLTVNESPLSNPALIWNDGRYSVLESLHLGRYFAD